MVSYVGKPTVTTSSSVPAIKSSVRTSGGQSGATLKRKIVDCVLSVGSASRIERTKYVAPTTIKIIVNQRSTNFNQRRKPYHRRLFSRISFSGRIPITVGKIASTHHRIARINKCCPISFNKSVDQSKTVAAIPKLRNIKTCVPLLFSSLIRLRSSFNRGSSEGSTIAEPVPAPRAADSIPKITAGTSRPGPGTARIQRLTAYYFFTLRFIQTGRGGGSTRAESETTPHTAQPKRRHNAAAATAIMTKSGPCMGA
jgi:hypothetical protein